MMTHRDCTALLDDFVDGELAPDHRRTVEEHLLDCERCRTEVNALLELRDRARALPRELQPERDLWAGIAARLDARSPQQRAAAIPIRRAADRRRLVVLDRSALAAAAVIVIAFSSLFALFGTRGGAGGLGLGLADAADQRPVTALAAFEPTEEEYLGTLESLVLQLESRREALSPATVAVVEENLRIIDGAIVEIRSALEAEEKSTELPLLLSGVYRQKVELLQTVLQLDSRS